MQRGEVPRRVVGMGGRWGRMSLCIWWMCCGEGGGALVLVRGLMAGANGWGGDIPTLPSQKALCLSQ